MNDALREAALVDPEWAREEARKRAVLIAVTAGAVIAIAIGIVALIVGVHNETRVTNIEPRVTKIEHTPCAKNATSKECQALRAKVERAANLYVTCLPFLKAGYPCPKPGSEAAQRKLAHESQAALKGRPEVGSEPTPAAATAPSANSDTNAPKPPKGGTHQHVAQGKGGGKKHPKPTRPAAPAPQPPSASVPAEVAPVEPGSSGNTPASEHSNGVKACIDLAVSACVKTELP